MKCPSCQADNKEEARFCRKCGSKLLKICPQCGSENLPDDNFCDMCGHNISAPAEPPPKELSFDERLAKIQRYLPKGVTEKILSQRDKIEGERKQVTVMFCDMEGFTGLSEKLGPEEAYTIMDQVYEILIHKVHDYEGTVNEMTGDGIMALFGAPIALEDAPQRAIRSAYSIHREMARFSNKVKEERQHILPLKMRIGIHTGPVVVGTLGNDLRVEFKAVGDTVNLASRVEGLAEPGSTYVTEDTFSLTEGLFRFEALGEKEVKGKEEPIKVYRVIAPSTRRTRFDVSAERGLTPFVGRERELEILLDGFERAKSGRGQAFSIMAEAGVGKSRLLYEFRKTIANEDVTFLEGKCLSYGRGVAYHPIIDLFRSNFDVGENDEDYQTTDKVKRGLKQLDIEEASTLPYLLELLSVKDSGIDQIPLSPEAKKDRMIEAMKRIPLKGSEIRPLIMAIEDLHWIDENSEEVLKYLLENISGSRILLIFTYRPEFVHTWGARSYHNQLNLNRLSNTESLLMVSHILGTREVDSDFEEFILEKTEGVPFFIEEFIKSLKDLKIIEEKNNKYYLERDIQDVTVPSTIQDVIMARVDSLPEDAKEVLQTGSVIEREFRFELINRVMGSSERALLSHLSILKDSELIFERGIFPDSTFIFKHALTREVVFDSILTSRKKKLHEKIGDSVEELYEDNLDEYYGILARHYITSENYEKGAEYSRLAGRKAEKTASYNEAIAYARKSLFCLEKLSQTIDVQKKIIDIRTTLGLYYIHMHHYIEAKETVTPIVDLAISLDYKRRISQVFSIMGTYYSGVEENFPLAYKYLEDALKIAEELNDILSLVMAHGWFASVLHAACEFERALFHWEKTLEINQATNTLWGISMIKSSISCFIYNFQGRINLSYKTSRESIQIAEESGDIYSKSMAYTSHGLTCYCRGFLKEAEENLLKGIFFCERIKYFLWGSLAYGCLGDVCFEDKEYHRAKDHYGKAIQRMEDIRIIPSLVNLMKIALAKAKVVGNDKGIELESLYVYEAENKPKIYEGWMPRYISEILLNIDDQDIIEAENWIKKAIEADNRNGMMWHLGRDYALYAELSKRKGDLSQARENLGKAIKILKECGADGWVDKYENELVALS